MKKVLLMFAFIATLLVGSMGTAGAQVNYTVYDGTNTSSYVPVYGMYCDSYLKCEYVIPATDLTAINGSNISALTYHLSSAPAAAWTCNFQVFVKEVASSTISSFNGIDDATIVYEGTLDATSGTMVVNFTTPYQYNGGNLLIGFYNTTTGNWKSASFYGRTISNSSVQGYNGSNPASISATQRNFIPKTTFTVDELHGCITPTQVAVNDITTYGATVTWTPGNTETAWTVKFNDIEFTTNTPSYTATTLDPLTTYVVSVKAVCSATEESEYSTPGVSFTTLPTCPAPTAVTFSNITTTSVDVAWTSHGSETAWTIDANGTEYAANSNPFTLTGLTPSSNYTIKVKANCSTTDESEWSATANVATACDAITLSETNPYSENFDSYTAASMYSAGVVPTCWGVISNGTNSNYNPHVSTAYAPISGSNCLSFRSGSSAYGSTNIAYLPEFTNPQSAVVTFAYKMENVSNGTLSVGYVTDVTDINSFVSAGSVASSTSAANGEIIIPATIPAGARIAFQWVCSSSSYDCGIDNVVVNVAPACSKPSNLTASNITATTAEISWTNGGSETAWTIMLDSTEIAVNTNPYVLTNLDPSTTYTVQIKSICSVNDESDYTQPITFTTPCLSVVVTEADPFVEDFNTLTTGIPSCWDNAEGTTTTDSYKWNYYETGNTGAAVRFNSYSNSNGRTNFLKTPVLDLSGLTNPMVTFSYKNPAGGDFSVYYTIDGTNYVEIATGLTGVSAWTNAEYIISDLAGAANARIIFKGTSNWGSGDAYIYLDDVMVSQAPTCPKPTDVTINNISTTSAEISWTNGGTETAWTISYNGTEIAANTNPFTLTGLTASTLYTIMVKANCSTEDESAWSNSAEFATSCAPYTVDANNPYTEDFTAYPYATSQYNDVRYMPLCWDMIFTGTVNNYEPTVYSGYYSNDVPSFAIVAGSAASYGTENYVIMPEFTNDYTTLQLSFGTTMEGGYGVLELGYITDITDATTFVTLNTIPSNDVNAVVSHEINLSAYTFATDARLAFRYGGVSSSYRSCCLYDVVLEMIPSCLRPTDVTILDAQTTENSAVVDWTPAGNETQWQVACNGDTTLVTAHPFTITGLDAATSYTVSVRAYCSAEDQSNWSTGVDFATECAVVVVTFDHPYHEGFEGAICWSIQQIAGDDNWNLSTNNPYEGEYGVVFPYTEGAEGLLVSPVLNLAQLANPELSFKYYTNEWQNMCDQMQLYYRTAATEAWVLIDTFATPMSGYDSVTYTLPTPTATYQIAFKGIGMDGNLIYLDDINITGEEADLPCEVPANVAVENNVATWESEAENFNVMYIVAGDTTTVNVAAHTYTFEGLEDSALVTVMVQAICDEETVSEWSEGVEFNFQGVGINNYSLNANVYPNPTHDVVNVECTTLGANLSVYDMFGKVVMNTTIQSERTELNFSNVAPGVYMIRIANNDAMTTVKVVKE